MKTRKNWFLVVVACLFVLFSLGRAGAVGIQPAGSGSGWQFERPVPQGNDLFAAWAAGPNDLYVGGHGGVLMHWDGTRWTMMDTPTQKTIFAIHGTGPNDIWAVGGDGYTLDNMDRSLIMHYNGSAWQVITPPNYSGYTYVLNSVHAISANNVWACHDGGPSVMHWDGIQWSFILPDVFLEGNLYAVTSVGADHVFFAGSHGQIVQYTGGAWVLEQKTEEGGFSTNLLQHLWAADLNTLYAGGNWGQVYHRNADGSWTDLNFPTAWGEDNTIRYLWGTSATDIYLMGNHSIRHYDGVNDPVRYDFSTVLRRQWLNGAGGVDRLFGIGPSGEVDQFLLDGLGGGTLTALAPVTDPVGFGITLTGAVGYGESGFVAFGSSIYLTDPYPMLLYDGETVSHFPELPPGMSNETMIDAGIQTGPDQFVIGWSNWLSPGGGIHSGTVPPGKNSERPMRPHLMSTSSGNPLKEISTPARPWVSANGTDQPGQPYCRIPRVLCRRPSGGEPTRKSMWEQMMDGWPGMTVPTGLKRQPRPAGEASRPSGEPELRPILWG